MMRALVLKASLLLPVLAFSSGLQDGSYEQSTPYPPGWSEAPSALTDYPVSKINDVSYTVINPWNYEQRLGILKVLVIASSGYFAPWGYNNTGNLLWGLPLQLGWQWASGRLQDMTGRGSCGGPLCVSPTSWWADMNYYLSVIPLLGALNAGVLSPHKYPVYIVRPANSSTRLQQKFCTSVQECSAQHPGLIEKWAVFFEIVRSMDLRQEGPTMDPKQDATVGHLWDAHTTSLHNALPLFGEELTLLSGPEMRFGRGWAQLVEFIAATHFETNFNNTITQQQVGLPPRVLHQGDRPPFISDLSKSQNRALQLINVFYDTNKFTKGLFLEFWKKAMCSEEGRADGRFLLEHLLEHPEIVPKEALKLIYDFIKDHKC